MQWAHGRAPIVLRGLRKMTLRRNLLIVNPAAGRYSCLERVKAQAAAWSARTGQEVDIRETVGRGHASEIARQVAEDGRPALLLACGGDGTLNEVVNGARCAPDIVIGHCPCGTGNDFIRVFSGDTEKFRDIGSLLDGHAVAIDLIDAGERVCLNVCSIGFDARVPVAMHSFRKLGFLGPKAPYNLAILHCLMKGVHEPYRLVVGGEEKTGRYTLICAMNGQFYGGGFNPTPESMPDDGLMDVLAVDAVSIPAFARLIGIYSSGGYRRLSNIIKHYRVSELEIVPEKPRPVNFDGETGESGHLRLHVLPGMLKFQIPIGVNIERNEA